MTLGVLRPAQAAHPPLMRLSWCRSLLFVLSCCIGEPPLIAAFTILIIAPQTNVEVEDANTTTGLGSEQLPVKRSCRAHHVNLQL